VTSADWVQLAQGTARCRNGNVTSYSIS